MTTFTDADFDTAREYLTGKDSYGFDDLLLIVRMLRSPRGCPWDREQTHSSIRADLLEETYELAEAIDLDSTELLREETGDVLLQTVLHSQISSSSARIRHCNCRGERRSSCQLGRGKIRDKREKDGFG